MTAMDWDTETANRFVKQVFEVWAGPEIMRRHKAGNLPNEFSVYAAQIIFSPDGNPPEIRLNDEVKAVMLAKLRAEVSAAKKIGDPVHLADLHHVEKVVLSPDDDQDCGHITIWQIGGMQHISFDARYNRRTAMAHIERAKEFLTTAELSHSNSLVGPTIDNLFSAAELAAKATLLSVPNPKFKARTNHKAIKTKYAIESHIGNVPDEFSKTLQKLDDLRDPARYMHGVVSVERNVIDQLVTAVKDMIDFAVQRYS